MKINNAFKSKVFKAAWKIAKKRTNWSWAACLRNAWKWAKENLGQPSLWSPCEGFFRLYFGDNYIQITVKSRKAQNSRETHRLCKGERFATGYYKLVGVSEETFNEHKNRLMTNISVSEFIESKF